MQDVALTRVLKVQRALHLILAEAVLPNGVREYRRIIAGKGLEYDVSVECDQNTFDALVGACGDLAWCHWEGEDGVHTFIQAEGSWSVDDPQGLVQAKLNLFVRDNMFKPGVFNPLVFA